MVHAANIFVCMISVCIIPENDMFEKFKIHFINAVYGQHVNQIVDATTYSMGLGAVG